MSTKVDTLKFGNTHLAENSPTKEKKDSNSIFERAAGVGGFFLCIGGMLTDQLIYEKAQDLGSIKGRFLKNKPPGSIWAEVVALTGFILLGTAAYVQNKNKNSSRCKT